MSRASTLPDTPLPPPAEWQSPLAWVGEPAAPPKQFELEATRKAVFVRGAVRLVISRSISEGITRSTEVSLPALIQLHESKPIAVHLAGIDGRCWTYWQIREGRKRVWKLRTGSEHPATQPAVDSPIAPDLIEYVYVQSLVGLAGTGKPVCFMIRDDGKMEDFTKAVDPDPRD